MQGTVLVVDDSTSIRSKIIMTLKGAHLFKIYLEAADGIEGFNKMLNTTVDLVLCDLEMPRMDGFKFIGLLQSNKNLRDVPVILLTGREDRALKIRGLEQGAVDYVTKPFDEGELTARVRVQKKIKGLQDELRQKNQMLEALSNTDYLTGLYNRRFLMDNLEMEFQRTVRKKGNLSLVLLDIDYFKKINDRYGHLQGDVVLRKLATTIKGSLRGYDNAARFGGEEFVLLLPETSLPHGMIVAERLRNAVAAMKLPPPLDQLTVTASLGVASFPEGPFTTVSELLKGADDALYRAKEKGRNRVEVTMGG